MQILANLSVFTFGTLIGQGFLCGVLGMFSYRKSLRAERICFVPQTDLSVGALTVLLSTGVWARPSPLSKTADNVYAQVRYFVHVTFAALR